MEKVKVSEVEVIPVKPHEGRVAFASCVINDMYYIGNIAVMTRKDGKGYFLGFPSKRLKNSRDIPIFHPIRKEALDPILKAVSKRANEVFNY